MPTVLIQYLGRQRNRVDDVLNTKRIWPAPMDVVEVSEAEAPHYTQHTGEWRRITREQFEEFKAKRAKVEAASAEIRGRWKDLTIEDLTGLRAQIDEEIATRKRAVADAQAVDAETAKQAASSEAPKPAPEDEAATAAVAERQAAIIEAIKQLDPNDPEDWAKSPEPAPRVARVTDITGFKVTKDEIFDALEVLEGPPE